MAHFVKVNYRVYKRNLKDIDPAASCLRRGELQDDFELRVLCLAGDVKS